MKYRSGHQADLKLDGDKFITDYRLYIIRYGMSEAIPNMIQYFDNSSLLTKNELTS